MLREHLTSGPEASALVTHGPHARSRPRQSKRTYCEHCKKTSHTKATCWTLHGKPTGWKPRQPNKAHNHQASTKTQTDKTPTKNHQSASSVGFNSDQLAKLYELFSNFQACSQSSTTLSSGSLAYKGTFLIVPSTMSHTTP